MISTQKSDKKNRPFCPRGSSPSKLRGGTDFRNFDYCELAAGHSVPEGGEMRQPRGAYPEGVRGVGDLESTSLF